MSDKLKTMIDRPPYNLFPKMTPKMAGMGLQCLGNSQIKISIRNKGVKIGLEIFSFLICRENFKDSKWKE